MVLQHYYFLLLELGYWVVPNIGHFFEVLAWSHKFEYPLSRLAISLADAVYFVAFTVLRSSYYSAFVGCYSCFYGRTRSSARSGRELAVSLWMSTVGGFYLAFFFFLSHNFDGVHFTEGAMLPETANTNKTRDS